MGRYDALKLENQLCFPLYACAREVIKKYTPLLKDLDLTYTQYIAMLVLWDKDSVSVKELGKLLFLDSGTLTPVLKSLEAKGLVHRSRSTADERVLIVQLTDNGKALKDRAVCVPEKVGGCIALEPDESKEMYRLLYKLLNSDK